MAELTVPLEDLIAQLDPEREYDRPYEQVVSAARSGALILAPGLNGPLIQDANTRTFVKGTGRRLGSQEHKVNAEKITAMFAGRIDEVDRLFFETLQETRDPRMFKIFYERVAAHPGQAFGGMAADEVLQMMAKLSQMSQAVPIEAESWPSR